MKDQEGRGNTNPLDEGIIDYVDTGWYGDVVDENLFCTAKMIANGTPVFGAAGSMPRKPPLSCWLRNCISLTMSKPVPRPATMRSSFSSAVRI